MELIPKVLYNWSDFTSIRYLSIIAGKQSKSLKYTQWAKTKKIWISTSSINLLVGWGKKVASLRQNIAFIANK